MLRVKSEFPEVSRGVPVIIVSAKGEPEDIQRGLAMGADAYLPKASFSMKSLIEEVRRVL